MSGYVDDYHVHVMPTSFIIFNYSANLENHKKNASKMLNDTVTIYITRCLLIELLQCCNGKEIHKNKKENNK